MKKRLRVVREAGGLGDLVRLFPVFAGLRRKYPDHEIHFYCLNHYRDLMLHCKDIDVYIPVNMMDRRPRLAPLDEQKYPYLDRGTRYDLEFDMFCPAYLHEVITDGKVTKERTHLWCEAAGVEFKPAVFMPWDEERIWADNWLTERMIDPLRAVILQPFGTSRSRNWAPDNWTELIQLMNAQGITPIAVDVCRRIAKLPCEQLVYPTFGQLGAILERCQLAISGDSGIFHFAAAVGTKALGLFGQTKGDVMIEGHRPGLVYYIQADPARIQNLECDFPCYGRWSRGYNSDCSKAGCSPLDAIPPTEVLAKICEIYRTIEGLDWYPSKKPLDFPAVSI